MKKQATILVADDERDVRRAVRMRLAARGYRVIEALNGLTVLSHHLSEPIAAIILDHGMPDATGREIARVIRNESDVPIIFLSGYDREHFREIVMEFPEMYYLPKPLDGEKLAALLSSITRERFAWTSDPRTSVQPAKATGPAVTLPA